MNIPIYRGKRLDNGEYIEGKSIINDIYGNTHLINEIAFSFNWEMAVSVNPTTLSIHFPDMLDSQGNRIFASLSEKGGSLLQYEGTIYEAMYLNYLIQGVTNMHSIKSELFEYAKAIGIQD